LTAASSRHTSVLSGRQSETSFRPSRWATCGLLTSRELLPTLLPALQLRLVVLLSVLPAPLRVLRVRTMPVPLPPRR
jgi:hypothetical protein